MRRSSDIKEDVPAREISTSGLTSDEIEIKVVEINLLCKALKQQKV